MRGRGRILPSILIPASLAGSIYAWVVVSSHRYLDLGLRRTALETLTGSLGRALLVGVAACVVVLLALLVWARVGAMGAGTARTTARAAGIGLAVLALGRATWSVGRSGFFERLADAWGTRGATAFLILLALGAVWIAYALRHWPAAGKAAIGLAGLFVAVWLGGVAYLAAVSPAGASERPNILLVSLDTLRADRVGCYGYDRPTTPGLDALAAEGALFDAATTPAPWTLPSHASMLTGLYPHHHGAVAPRSLLQPAALTLPELLREAGYRTAAFAGGGHLSPRFGFGQGFQHFEDLGHPETAETVDRAIDWLESEKPRPFFLFVHTYEPHMPYRDRTFVDPADAGSVGETFERDDLLRLRHGRWTPNAEERRYISDLYDGDARSTDEGLQPLWAWLESRGLMDRTLVIVVSDHGEELFERGARHSVRHGHTLYDELIRIPMIVRYPESFPAGTRVAAPASLVDLTPTMAAAAGIEWPLRSDGLDLASLLTGPARNPKDVESTDTGERTDGETSPKRAGSLREVVLSEALGSGTQRRALRSSRYKYIAPVEPGAAPEELYDLIEDPGELANLLETRLEIATSFAAKLEGFDPFTGGSTEATLDRELEDQLRALGYIE